MTLTLQLIGAAFNGLLLYGDVSGGELLNRGGEHLFGGHLVCNFSFAKYMFLLVKLEGKYNIS